jgi:protein phosphatase 2C family protein 2/3
VVVILVVLGLAVSQGVLKVDVDLCNIPKNMMQMNIQTKKQQCEFWDIVECTTQGNRPSMEDRSTLLYPFTSSSSVMLGVFDGHAGGLCSNYIAQTLPGELQKQTKQQLKTQLPTQEVLQDVFHSTDRQWLSQAKCKAIEDGSTALCVVLDGPELIVANCGDSRALLHQAGQTIALTRDHIPEDDEEKQRIIKLGGYVIGGRLQGKLGVSRAFGNIEFKECKYLISDPEVKEVSLHSDAEFLVVGCDGLFEQFTNDEIISFIKNKISSNSLDVVVKDLVEEALDRGSHDNITIIVVKFNKAYSKLVKKSTKKSLSKSQKIFPVSKGSTLKTSGKNKTAGGSSSPKPMSLSEPIVKIKKDNTLRTAGKHPISSSSLPMDPGSLFPSIQLPFSDKKSHKTSPKNSCRNSLIDLPEEKTKSHSGLKSSLFGRTLTKSS